MRKFAFIMRGVPGSGKSTVANFLAEKTGGIVHSVDDYHTKNGEFVWSDKNEEEHYNKNFDAFKESCQKNIPIVVIPAPHLPHQFE